MKYRDTIVGRKHEQDILQMCYDSPKAEFVAVYGRRRIGKTYLVKQYFDEQFDFYANGKILENAGVINGYDSTTESALGKLFYLMGKSQDNNWVRAMMQRNLKGEISK